LLLEPQRTNLVQYSEYLGGYTTSGTGTGTDNAETSPEGYTNAFTLNDTSTGAYYRIEDNITLSGGDHTLSVFLKKTTGALSHYAGVQLDTGRKYVIVDTTNGTYNEAGSSDNDSITIQDWNSDWWRVIITNNIVAGTRRVGLWPSISSDGSSIAVGATGENTFYGVQVEAGSYATSYIPTYGSAVTRNVDAAYDLSAADLIGNDEGVFFIDVKTPSAIASNTTFSIGGGTNGEYAQLEIRTDLSINWRYRQGSTDYINANVGSYVAGDRLKLAFAYKNGSSILYKNGSSIATDNGSINTNAWDEIRFSNFAGTGNLNASVNQALVFKTRLTNEELAALTTL
jgi:hypothetical protein